MKDFDLRKLKKPFPANDVEWRVKTSGKNGKGPWAMLLPYITNRAIMNRLDEEVGPENWKNYFESGPSGGTMCGLSVRVDNEWITKWDGAQETAVEPVKGGFSDAMKRAAVQWGIGRYLYHLDFQVKDVLPDRPGGRFIRIDDQKKGIKGYAIVPTLPAWALPVGDPDFGGDEEQGSEPDQKKRSDNKGRKEEKTEKRKPATPNPPADKSVSGSSIKGITYRREGNLLIAEGNTFAVKGSLKSAGFKWNPGAKAWAKAAVNA